MEDEKWGIGNRKDEKPFDSVKIGNDTYDLIFGEHPHSRQDNTMYVRYPDGGITGFDGHRLPFKIIIEEINYMKSSRLSGDQIRKSCNGKLFLNDVQIFDCHHRGYERCYMQIQRFIDDMEMNWSWYPKNLKEKIGKTVGYREQLFVIKSFIVEQGAMILETKDGKLRKLFMWESEEDNDDITDSLKVEITSPHIEWYPEIKK